jgi:crossover junction endodeoxyribonuclease RusA
MIVTNVARGGLRHPKATLDHRSAVAWHLARAWGDRAPEGGPAAVRILATLPRPKGHWGTGRNADVLRASAPARPVCYPDADKIARLVNDALVLAGVLVDDDQVAVLRCEKVYADRRDHPGATEVEVWALWP